MLKLQHITKIFNRGEVDEHLAVNDLSLSIDKGELVMMIGANGSGKTTLLNLLQGSIHPDQGNILLNEKNITNTSEYNRSKSISRVFQDPKMGTAPDLTLLENFRLASLRTQNRTFRVGINNDFRKRVTEEVSRLGMGLEKKLDMKMGSLSGGQRQALTLLMAVMDKSDLLLMDEPTAALDPKSAEVIMKLTTEICHSKGIATLLITHSMKDALQYGNRLLMLKAGKIIQDHSGKEKEKLTLHELHQWFDV